MTEPDPERGGAPSSHIQNAVRGKARADSVWTALAGAGFDTSRIETASGGETDPVETNSTAAG